VATNTEKRRGWLLERERRAALRAAAANAVKPAVAVEPVIVTFQGVELTPFEPEDADIGTIIDAAAERFDARHLHRASIEARQELASESDES
jgi:hypothetical protein